MCVCVCGGAGKSESFRRIQLIVLARTDKSCCLRFCQAGWVAVISVCVCGMTIRPFLGWKMGKF